MSIKNFLFGALCVAAFLIPGVTLASTSNAFWYTVNPKTGLGPLTLKSFNIGTGTIKQWRTLPGQSGIDSTIINPVGTRVVYDKGEDAYSGNVYGTNEKRIVRFTGCKGDSSCMLTLTDLSSSGTKAIVNYEGESLYNFSTGTLTKIPSGKITSSLVSNPRWFSPSGAYMYDDGAMRTDTKGVATWGVSYVRTGGTTTTFLPVSKKLVDSVRWSPDETRIAAPAGEKVFLIHVATKKITSSITATHGALGIAWLWNKQFVFVDSTTASVGKPGFNVHLVTVSNGIMTSKVIYTAKDRFFKKISTLDSGRVLLEETNKGDYSDSNKMFFSTLTASGKHKDVLKLDNDKHDSIVLVGVTR